MITHVDFLYSTYITLAYALLTTGIEVGLGLVIAMLLNRESRVAKILTPTLIFPMVIAPVIGTLVWKMMMQPSVGILNPMLNAIGLPSLQWAAVPETALFSVVLVDVWMFTPFAALILTAGLRSFPSAPFEAARVDGASFWFTFRNLTLPMLMPFLIIVVVFRLMDSLKMFDIIFAMTEGGPGNTLMTYQLTAYRTSDPVPAAGAGVALCDPALHHHLHLQPVFDQVLGPRPAPRRRVLSRERQSSYAKENGRPYPWLHPLRRVADPVLYVCAVSRSSGWS